MPIFVLSIGSSKIGSSPEAALIPIQILLLTDKTKPSTDSSLANHKSPEVQAEYTAT